MLLHTSPKARYVKSERDLSHIELAQRDNISSLSAVKAYRVNEVDISTEEKNKSKNRRICFLLLLLFLLGIWLYNFCSLWIVNHPFDCSSSRTPTHVCIQIAC